MNDAPFGEELAIFFKIFMMVLAAALLVSVFVMHSIYYVKYIEDSACRSGFIYVLVEEENGTRTWNATEARCSEEKEKQ